MTRRTSTIKSRGIENDLENLKSDGARIQKDVTELGRNVGRAAYDQVEQISDRTREYMERGREQAQEMTGSFQDQIRTQPIRSVLLAAGVGFLAGALGLHR